jgi:uncharacterized protein
MEINNKTIQYRLKATDTSRNLVGIDDTASLTLPAIEKLTDTMSGAGIMGEIDMPTFGQIGSMVFTVNNRADNPQYAMLSRPGEIKFEVVWLVDLFDTAGAKIGIKQHKVFMSGVNKTYNGGNVEVNAGADGSSEFEIYYYRKIVDGKEILLIDKFNFKYVVNGVDYMANIRAALQ